jgi:hypothetical protein
MSDTSEYDRIIGKLRFSVTHSFPEVTSQVVPRGATLVETTYVETDFPINAMLKWEDSFRLF